MMNGGTIVSLTLVVAICLGGGLWGCPQYNVYAAKLGGEASLKRAEQDRQIRVQEANAKLEASKMEAQAEVERAKGTAEANKIIADSLGGPEGYLRWRYIYMLEESASKPNREVIYIPTEANLPVLEAGRLNRQIPASK